MYFHFEEYHFQIDSREELSRYLLTFLSADISMSSNVYFLDRNGVPNNSSEHVETDEISRETNNQAGRIISAANYLRLMRNSNPPPQVLAANVFLSPMNSQNELLVAPKTE